MCVHYKKNDDMRVYVLCVYVYLCIYGCADVCNMYLLDHINYVGCLVELLKEIIFFLFGFGSMNYSMK